MGRVRGTFRVRDDLLIKKLKLCLSRQKVQLAMETLYEFFVYDIFNLRRCWTLDLQLHNVHLDWDGRDPQAKVLPFVSKKSQKCAFDILFIF